MTAVDVVIVNWNAGPQLRDCVASIFEHEDVASAGGALGSVTVVDNASHDGSADFCRSDPRVRLAEPGRNLGFGTACNLGAAQGAAEYVLFLNPDTRLLKPTLQSVAAFMENALSAKIGVCGVRLVGAHGETWKHCSRFPSAATLLSLSAGLPKILPRWFQPLELVEFDHLQDAQVPHVMGAFYFVRRTLFEEIGGFDERFFVYYEDIDLSLRIAQSGYVTQYLASEAIFHRTAGTTSQGAKAKALSYLLEGRLRYARKHYGAWGAVTVVVAILLVEPVRRLVHAVAARSPTAAGETVKAMARLWAIVLGFRPDRA